MSRLNTSRTLLALAVGCCALALTAQSSSSARGQEGGILRISLSPAAGVDHIDPALSFTQAGWALLDTTCARLMTYPDKPAPQSFELIPEVAAAYRSTRDFKRYTFTLRRGFRFSDGSPVRASAFAQAINRALAQSVRSPGALHMQDIVGARDVLAGRTQKAAGVDARGYTLVVRFTRPAPDFPVRTAMPFFCAVPPNLPPSAEGADEFPSAGPFYVQEYRPNERVIIKRNPHYGGARKVHLDGFEVVQGGSPAEMIRRIDREEADWGHMVAGVYFGDPTLNLPTKYGIDRSRFWVKPGLTLRMLAFNSSRPLFRSNPRLRRAVNFALDRQALEASGGGHHAGRLTDQYLPHSVPGFREAEIYPLHRPDLARAKALARGSLRGRSAILFTADFALALQTAQVVKQQLAELGLEIEIRTTKNHIASATYLEELAAHRTEWDLALVLWTPSIPDPHAYLNQLLETPFLDGETLTRFRSNIASRGLRRAARTLQARERSRLYADLDATLARDHAPLAALGVVNEVTFVSSRVGCIVLRPVLDLAVACLKR